MENTLNEREQGANKKRAIEEAEKKKLMERLEASKNLIDAYKKQIENAKQEAAEKYSQLEYILATGSRKKLRTWKQSRKRLRMRLRKKKKKQSGN